MILTPDNSQPFLTSNPEHHRGDSKQEKQGGGTAAHQPLGYMTFKEESMVLSSPTSKTSYNNYSK